MGNGLRVSTFFRTRQNKMDLENSEFRIIESGAHIVLPSQASTTFPSFGKSINFF